MTPDAWGSLIERFGLPLVILTIGGYLVVKRIFVLGSEMRERLAGKDEEIAFHKAETLRERNDRTAAQNAAKELAPASAEVAEAVAGLAKTVLERLPPPDLYEERLEGTRRRGR